MKLLATYFLFFSIMHEGKVMGGDQCSPCTCYPCPTNFRFPEHIECVRCNFDKLVSLPPFPRNFTKNIGYLYIAWNRIQTLENGMFAGYSSLQDLTLRYNGITTISDGAFNGLESLTKLTLYREKITTISEGMFNGLQNLTELSLHSNQITNISDGAFNHLQRLSILKLWGNKITTISEGAFNGLRRLTNIHLYYNKISTISDGAFSDLQSLTELLLFNNQIANISEGTFIGLKRLTKLRLYNNKISTISDGAFSDLQSLTELLLTNNQITNISEGTFIGLQRLAKLSLISNKISTIFDGAFSDLQSLTELYLHNNQITNISECTFNGLKRLTKLHLYNNKISTISDGVFSDLQSLIELLLENNQITNISESTFIGLKRLEELDLSGNTIAVIPGSTFMGLQRLHTLLLRNNKITDIHEGTFTDLTKVKMVDLSQNQIEYLPSDTFKDMVSLARLHLSRNNISYIQQNVFLPLGNLFRLHLEYNNFKVVPSVLWTSPLSHVSVYLDNNPFNCSCKLLNDLKQLRHKVKRLLLSASYYEERCTNITSVCEDVRNFALGMRLVHNCSSKHEDNLSVMKQLQSEFAATDENLTTYGSCKSYFASFLQIDLPGVIVVTKVVIVLTYVRSSNVKYVNITIAVGDKLSNTYEPCNKFPLTFSPYFGMIAIQGTCITTPSGRDVRVVMSPKRFIPLGSCILSINVHEIHVNGYEKHKYNLWSEWNEWGPCSTTCGNGLRQRNRTCTNATSLSCELQGQINQRSHEEYTRESCNLEPCFQAVYQWTIGVVGGVFVLTVLGIVFWYRKFKMIRYLEGLRPNPNFELDPNKTLLEQIEELPYDLHWEFPRYDVRFGSVIGEGHFGRVWLAKAKGIRAFNPRDQSDLSSRAKLSKLQDQRVHDYFTTVTESWLLGDCDTTRHYDVAVKTLKECATPKHQMDLASELKLLIYMGRNPNIVNLLASCTIRGDLWVIMEYCDYGSLKTFLSDRRKLFTPLWSKNSTNMSSEICFFDLLQMTEQIVKGVMFLHCWKVVHRDLSARNILVDENFNLKIADFGLARSENFVAPLDDILPIKWSSLESLLRHEYTTKSDIWSVAVLFWEIFSFGEVPYPGMSSREVIQQLKEGYRMSAPDHCPEEMWNIITVCWNADPDERPSAMELFEQLDEVKTLVCSAPDEQYYGASGGDYEQAGTVEGPSLDEIIEGKENMGFEGEGSETSADVHKTSTKDTAEKYGPSTISYDEYQKLERENCRLRNENQNLKTSIEGTADKSGPCMIPQEEHQELKSEIYRLRNEIRHLKTSIEGTADKSGPCIIPQEEHQELESENCRLRSENQHLKENEEKYKSIIEEMKTQEERFMKTKKNINKDIEKSTEISENIDSSDTVGDTDTIDNSTELNENIESSDTVHDTDTIDNSQGMICMDTIELMNLPPAEIGVDALAGTETNIESQM